MCLVLPCFSTSSSKVTKPQTRRKIFRCQNLYNYPLQSNFEVTQALFSVMAGHSISLIALSTFSGKQNNTLSSKLASLLFPKWPLHNWEVSWKVSSLLGIEAKKSAGADSISNIFLYHYAEWWSSFSLLFVKSLSPNPDYPYPENA